MLLSEITLNNFRNYTLLKLKPEKEINLFFGNNAAGKTNLIEAIFYLFSSYSYRTRKDFDLIYWKKTYFKINGQIIFSPENKKTSLSISFYPPREKKLKVNNCDTSKADYYTGFPVVLFNPQDVNLIKGSPSERRRFMDMEICRVFPLYFNNLVKYNRTLRQRNALLKSPLTRSRYKQELYPYNILLSSYGSKIIMQRVRFLKKLQEYSSVYLKSFTRNQEKISITYGNSLGLDFRDIDLENNEKEEAAINEALKNKILEKQEEDILKKYTISGPHNEDFTVMIDQKISKNFSSQGQQRTAAICLKLSIMDMLIDEKKQKPILLLDDIFSELDKYRRELIVKEILNRKIQCFITGNEKIITGENANTGIASYQIREGSLAYA